MSQLPTWVAFLGQKIGKRKSEYPLVYQHGWQWNITRNQKESIHLQSGSIFQPAMLVKRDDHQTIPESSSPHLKVDDFC